MSFQFFVLYPLVLKIFIFYRQVFEILLCALIKFSWMRSRFEILLSCPWLIEIFSLYPSSFSSSFSLVLCLLLRSSFVCLLRPPLFLLSIFFVSAASNYTMGINQSTSLILGPPLPPEGGAPYTLKEDLCFPWLPISSLSN